MPENLLEINYAKHTLNGLHCIPNIKEFIAELARRGRDFDYDVIRQILLMNSKPEIQNIPDDINHVIAYYLSKSDKAKDIIPNFLDRNTINKPYACSTGKVGSQPSEYSLFNNSVMLGSIETLKILIAHGADPAFIDKFGMTSLHYAASFGKMDVLKFLIEHTSARNLINHPNNDDGFTPLHMAAINTSNGAEKAAKKSGKVTILQYLKKHGANENLLSTSGAKYNDLIKISGSFEKDSEDFVEIGFAEDKSYGINLDNDFLDGFGNLYQLLALKTSGNLSNNNLKTFLNNAVKALEKLYNSPKYNKFVFDPENLENEGSIRIANTLQMFKAFAYEYKKSEQRTSSALNKTYDDLEAFIVRHHTKFGMYSELKNFFNTYYDIYDHKRDFENCIKYNELSLKVEELNSDKMSYKEKFLIYLEDGIVFYQTLDHKKSLSFINKAKELILKERGKLLQNEPSNLVKIAELDNDWDKILMEEFSLNSDNQDNESAYKASLELKNEVLHHECIKVIKKTNGENFDNSQEEKISDSSIALASLKKMQKGNTVEISTNRIDVTLDQNQSQDWAKEFEEISSSIDGERFVSTYSIPVNLANRLIELYSKKNFEKSLSLINYYYQKYPSVMTKHSYLKLKHFEFLLYEGNGDFEKSNKVLEDLIGNIDSHCDSVSEYVQNIWKSRILEAITNKDFDKIEAYIGTIRDKYTVNKGIWHEKTSKLLKIASSYLSGYKDFIQQFTLQEEQIVDTKTESEFQNFIRVDLEDVSEDATTDYSSQLASANVIEHEISVSTPNKIAKRQHKYFQTLKKIQVNTGNSTHSMYQGWKIGANSYSAKYNQSYPVDSFVKAVKIHSGAGADYFGAISPVLASSLDTTTLDRFKNALEKGLVSRNYGQNGVKYFKGSVYTLKIDDDIRLYGNVVYHNKMKENEFIIIFDKTVIHSQLGDLINSSALRVEDCEAWYTNFENITSYSYPADDNSVREVPLEEIDNDKDIPPLEPIEREINGDQNDL